MYLIQIISLMGTSFSSFTESLATYQKTNQAILFIDDREYTFSGFNSTQPLIFAHRNVQYYVSYNDNLEIQLADINTSQPLILQPQFFRINVPVFKTTAYQLSIMQQSKKLV